MKTALITGVSGQGGAYLSEILLEKGYRVIGTTRNLKLFDNSRLVRLGVADQVDIKPVDFSEVSFIEDLIEDVQPEEFYHLASPSSVMRSFNEPLESNRDIYMSTLNVLEAIRRTGRGIRFFNASSGEMFGSKTEPVSEGSLFAPLSPYAVAKTASHFLVSNYREAYGLFASSGILFNFESPLRPSHYVTKKVVNHAVRISAGENIKLELGDVSVVRDWGFAPEYMDAAWRMLQLETPQEVNIASGSSHSLKHFVELVFQQVDLDFHDFVKIDSSLMRPLEIDSVQADVSLSRSLLNWEAATQLADLVKIMIREERAELGLHQYDRNLKLIKA